MELKGKISSIIGDDTFSLLNKKKEVYVLESINKYTKKKKIVEALNMVNLNEDYLLRKSNDLSNVEYNKLLLVNDLVNKEKVIVLDHFEKGLCHKEKEYFKRLFRKISKEYGIGFIIKTNDFSFCLGLVDQYLLVEENEIVEVINKKDIYDKEVYKYFDKHELIDFVLESRKKGHLLDDYYNASDILKAIYRELEWDILL